MEQQILIYQKLCMDTAGAMFSSNTETNVTATYQDGETIDQVEQQLNNTVHLIITKLL